MPSVFVWRLIDDGGRRVESSEPFAERDAAESWLGSGWQDLAERGIAEVELVEMAAGDDAGDEDRVIYRMRLDEA
jgi:hypothetical protein